MIFTIQTDKNEPQRKAVRVTAKTIGGAYGTAGKPLSNVIRRKWEWRSETWESANESRGDRSGAVYKYPCIRQVQAVFLWPSSEKQQVKSWALPSL